MVLEQILNLKTIEKKSINVFLLGIVYTFVGILCARLVFPQNTGIMSVAFTSILLIPSLSFMLQVEENVEIRERKFSLKLLFKDHKDIFKLYILLFLAIFIAYSLTALFWPGAGITQYFSAQTNTAGITGSATGGLSFSSVIANNMLVLFVCFMLSLIYGAGAILFLTWNASLWGIVIGFFAHEAAVASHQNLVVGFVAKILPFLPHMTTEAAAYISAAIVGGVVSKAVLREKLFTDKFHHIITDAVMLLAIGIVFVLVAALIEVYVAL
jgi:uncharacterized membrane protein SpoIIM required for sporulation